MLELIFIFVFLDCMIVLYILYAAFSNKKTIMNRMQHYLNPEKNREKVEREKTLHWREGLSVVGKTIGRSRIGSRYRERVEISLVQAHLPLKPEEYITIKGLLFLLIFGIIYPVSRNPAAALLLAVLSTFIPGIYVSTRKRSIIQKIDQQLPDTITLISNTLKAGYSFLQALDSASKELPPPISSEFRQMMKEINLGVNTDKALEALSKRVQSEDLELIMLAVLIQRQIGGNLSEILDNISETIRSRIKIKGEIRILTAQGRISGLIISLMPLALGFIIYLLNPEYIRQLFQHPLGWGMLVMAILMQAVGIFFIKRIIGIEV